jgi:hypothetical protein
MYGIITTMGKRQPFDKIAGRNIGAIIASGSSLYVIRHAISSDGGIHYASPILDPEKVLHLGDRMVTVLSRAHIRKAMDNVLKQHGCFYT